MKLYWKLFLGMVATTLFAFAIFGGWMLQSSFQSSMNKEKEQCAQENLMYQYAFLTALENLPEQSRTDENIADVAQSVSNTAQKDGNIFRLYDADMQVIYESGKEYTSSLCQNPPEQGSSVTQAASAGSRYYLETLLAIACAEETYYLERDLDISYIFEERERMYGQYRMAILVIFVLVGIWSMIFARGITGPLRGLSRVTRRFSRGDYEVRGKARGQDEVSSLIRDFNAMADHLEANMDQLRESARVQEDFTAAFAHELKTPLTSIIGYADMLRSMELNEEERLSSANYIYQQGRRLERLSHKMLDLISIDKQTFAFQAVSAEELGASLEEMTRGMLMKKNIGLTMQLAPGLIYGDRDLLLSLFGNFIDNSRKACGEGGHIWLKGTNGEDGYRLLVLDNGRGMPKEEVSRVTEAFYMVDKSRARKEGGSGIGLALCSRIAVLHGAKWQMDSEPGKGTAVLLTFPPFIEEERHEDEEE